MLITGRGVVGDMDTPRRKDSPAGERHRYAAARQTEDDDVWLIGVTYQSCGQDLAASGHAYTSDSSKETDVLVSQQRLPAR